MAPYQPELWHDFFLATAGAAAALAGLLFVALSLHTRYIATNTVYRDMARGSVIGLVMALILSLLVLVQQPVTWLAAEYIAAGGVYVVFVGGRQLLDMRRARRRIPGESLVRSMAAYVLSAIGIVAGIGLAFSAGPGLYAVAVIVVAIVLWSLWNAWELVMGVADEEIETESAQPGSR
jgi:modulator of FtsH protease